VTTPYANTAIATKQIALTGGGAAVKVGSGAAGVPLASRLLWRGEVLDPNAKVYIGSSAVTTATGFPMQAGIPELRAYGPAVDIYAISDLSVTIYVEEASG
jgi:hypothetical protein